MNDVGKLLRETREARGVTLQEVSEATNIRTRYLEAIERGEYDIIPADVYTRGFIRSYADFLGLDGPELVARYREMRMIEETAEIRLAERERNAADRKARGEVKRRRGRAFAKGLLTAIVILLAAAGLYYALRALDIIEWRPKWLP